MFRIQGSKAVCQDLAWSSEKTEKLSCILLLAVPLVTRDSGAKFYRSSGS